MRMLILKYQTCLPWQMLAHSPVSMSNEVYGYIYANLKSNFK